MIQDAEFVRRALPILFDLLLEGAGSDEVRRRIRDLLEAATTPS